MVLNSIPVTFTVLLTFSFIIFTNSQTCKPHLNDTFPLPIEGINITASEIGYPSDCTDYIWSFTENVEIKIHWLRIDGQSGDFLMISSRPPNIPDPDNINLDTMMPVGDFKLISWVLELEDKSPVAVSVLSPTGSFLYFHSEVEVDVRNLTHREGFLIEILPFEKYIPTVEPTTEKYVPTPHPEQEAFVVRFLSGKHPEDFMTALPDFRSKIAIMATNYSNETGLIIPGGIGADDVVVPTKDIRYCDEKWREYQACVEVKFGIAVENSEGNYVMTKDKLDEMWKNYNVEPLEEMGLYSFEPKESTPDMVPYVWVAAMLGVIAVFSGGLCVIWLKGVTEDIRNDSRPIEQTTERNENLVDTNAIPFYASVNPIIAEWQERIGNNQITVSDDIELVEQGRRGGHGHEYDGAPFYQRRRDHYLDVPLH